MNMNEYMNFENKNKNKCKYVNININIKEIYFKYIF